MTKKNYIAIAAVVREAYINTTVMDNQSDRDVGGQVAHEIAEGLANAFRDDNPRFDKFRFLKACGVCE